MRKEVRVAVADSAGNITIFVRDPFPREEYAAVAEKLLEKDFGGLKGEQVCFLLPCPTCGRAMGKLEMCGLEFCGNASRTYGLMIAKEMGIEGEGLVYIDASGVNEILDVWVDTRSDYAKIRMPLPKRMFRESILGKEVDIVDFGGILHLVVTGEEGTQESFEKYKRYIYERYNPQAMGVMFWQEEDKKLNPAVYVKDIDSLYFEGSCASGSTACCCVFGLRDGDGLHSYELKQPAGVLNGSVLVKNGKIESVFIEGPVTVSDDMTVEIDY